MNTCIHMGPKGWHGLLYYFVARCVHAAPFKQLCQTQVVTC